jgi:prepilin-type N-terminal cleavage/methylation domain-containing protein
MKTGTRFQAGYTLIEVLIGILVFALGMMALAQLQGNLSKASAEANARTVALNIAEEEIEALRSFSQLTDITDESAAAFDDIVSFTKPVSRGGLEYTVTAAVTPYYYDPGDAGIGSFTPIKPHPDMVYADLKRLEMTVSWGIGEDAQSFQIDGNNATTAMGTGSVTLTDLISSFTTTTGGKIITNGTEGLYAPPVTYNPGQNPDIVSIQLGPTKFKESTTPLPDVVRDNELVETRFDVVTYSQDASGATFLRREEFRALSCECTLQVPSTSEQGGLRPTIWDGNEYVEGEFVSKPYGISANNQQSVFCDLCCRDHHDGGIGENDVAGDPGRSRYSPFRNSSEYYDASHGLNGDHPHYWRDNRGNLVLAESHGDNYLESCRMIRKDGFWRIAQDLRQEGLNAFPGDYLDDSAEVTTYSRYVTGAVSDYEEQMEGKDQYELGPPLLMLPQEASPAVHFPASIPENPTVMAPGGVVEQQLRARGIYIDYMSDELRARINCLDLGGSGPACDVPAVTTALEIIPFYDVQLTWLARWTEEPSNIPIDVSNEAIVSDNQHSRGLAELVSGTGDPIINSEVHIGNLGLTGTDPIDPWYTSQLADYELFARAEDSSTPPQLSGIVISGDIISAVPGVRAADVEVTGTGAVCDRTNTGYHCELIVGSNNPKIVVDNYFKLNFELVACSEVLRVHGTEHSTSTTSNADNWTRFNLPWAESPEAHIVIQAGSCGTGG